MTAVQTSAFARALKDLLDETDFYTRPEWARFLIVEETSLDDWVSDKALPGGDRLGMMLDLLQMRSIQREPIERFDHIAVRPAAELSPLGAFMAPTVSHYLKYFTFAELGRRLRTLSPEQQSRVLRGSWDQDAIETYLQYP